jgi:hypothetical protein
MIKKLEILKDISLNNNSSISNVNKKFFTQRNSINSSVKNNSNNSNEENKRANRFCNLNESPSPIFKSKNKIENGKKDEIIKEDLRKNFYSTQAKFFSKKKEETPIKQKTENEIRIENGNGSENGNGNSIPIANANNPYGISYPNAIRNTNTKSFNFTLGPFENLNPFNKLDEKFKNTINTNKLKYEMIGTNFYKTENSLRKNLSPNLKNINAQSLEMKNKNNLDKFLLDPRKKINIIDEKELKEKLLNLKSQEIQIDKNVGTTNKSLINLNNPNIKFPYHNNLNKYSGMELSSPIKSNEEKDKDKDKDKDIDKDKDKNRNINININNKITNIYQIKGDFIEGKFDKSNIDKNLNSNVKSNLTEEEIMQKINLYKSKLNSQLIKLINDEKSKEKERMNDYDNSEKGDNKKTLENQIANERVLSLDRIKKMNE